MLEESDAVALVELVDRALSDQVVSTCAPLTLFDGRLLEKLSTILPRHLGPQATRAVIRELRLELLDGKNTTLAGLQRVIGGCTRCPGLSPPPVQAIGNLDDPEMIVVVESFYGLNVVEVWRSLEEAGITRHRGAITAITRCRGAVGPEDIKRCSEFLMAEVEVLKPEVLVTMGSAATQVLLGPATKISEARGRMWWLGPWAVLPTYSLAYASRGGRAESDLREDLASAKRFLDG